MKMRKAKYISLMLAIMMLTNSCSLLTNNDGEETPLSYDARIVEADTTWTELMEGNEKFANGTSIVRVSKGEREDLSLWGQSPKAVVVTCSDSRLTPEYIFGTEMGEIFVIRTAGNVIGDYEIGSIEYAVEHLDVPLVIVLGHTACGAVGGAINGSDGGYLGEVINEIKPLVTIAQRNMELADPNASLDDEALLTVPNVGATTEEVVVEETDENGEVIVPPTPEEQLHLDVTKLNVYHAIDNIYKSDILTERVGAQKLKIVGALYDMETGLVTPYGEDTYTLGNEILYERALEDVLLPEANEQYPLVSLVKNNANVQWNEAGDKVLVGFWHDSPNTYPKDTTVVTTAENWVYSQGEMEKWYTENSDLPADRVLRFEQLLGLPEGQGFTHFTTAWVAVDDIFRPAYDFSTDTTMSALDFPIGTAPEYVTWFDSKIVEFYHGTQKYPWSRLGYTYDWADNGKEYGLSEFVVYSGAEIIIDNTLTLDQYIDSMRGNTW